MSVFATDLRNGQALDILDAGRRCISLEFRSIRIGPVAARRWPSGLETRRDQCETAAMHEQSRSLFAYLFPVFFIGMWLGITTILGALSGWFNLQRRYPAGTEKSRLTLRMRSGRMGLGVYMSGLLTLSACPSGLRISVLRMFGPFQRAFTVPWEQIRAEPRTVFFMPSVKLSFGGREFWNLTIDARLWQRLIAHSSVAGGALELPSISVKRAGFGLLARWGTVTACAATFYYFGPRAAGGVGPPLVVCVGFPAIAFGLAMLVRFLQQVRS